MLFVIAATDVGPNNRNWISYLLIVVACVQFGLDVWQSRITVCETGLTGKAVLSVQKSRPQNCHCKPVEIFHWLKSTNQAAFFTAPSSSKRLLRLTSAIYSGYKFIDYPICSNPQSNQILLIEDDTDGIQNPHHPDCNY